MTVHPVDIILLVLVLLPPIAGLLLGPLHVLVQLVNWVAASVLMLTARSWLPIPAHFSEALGGWGCFIELLACLLGTLMILSLLQRFLLMPMLHARREPPTSGRRFFGGIAGLLLGIVAVSALTLPVRAMPIAWKATDAVIWPIGVRIADEARTLLSGSHCRLADESSRLAKAG